MSERQTVNEFLAKVNPSKGIVCRKCGCVNFSTYRTVPTSCDKIMRIRYCRNCGAKRVTYES